MPIDFSSPIPPRELEGLWEELSFWVLPSDCRVLGLQNGILQRCRWSRGCFPIAHSFGSDIQVVASYYGDHYQAKKIQGEKILNNANENIPLDC